MNLPTIDRARASQLLQQAGLDALVICEPEAFHYVTGLSQGVAGLFRRAGGGFALISADPTQPIGVVVGDINAAAFSNSAAGLQVRSHPLWIETAQVTAEQLEHGVEQAISAAWAASRPQGFARPATFSLQLALTELRLLLAQQGLTHARLGFDLDFVPSADDRVIRQALPGATISNGSPVFNRLRMVKSQPEIDRLRLAAQLSEAGIQALVQQAADKQSVAELGAAFRHGVAQEASLRGIATPKSWEYIAIGPEPWNSATRLSPDAIVKVDVGCYIDGYSSDSSRNFIFGQPSAAQARLHQILEQAFDTGLSHIGPGKPLAAVHHAVTQSLQQSGLNGFSRGHFGHGVGQSLFSEQWPFISADAEVEFEPGMVIAFEVPIYVNGIGGFNIEDQLLITPSGIEIMNQLPRTLVPLGA